METTSITVNEKQLEKLKYASNVNKLNIKFLSYTRIEPQKPLGHSEAIVELNYETASDLFLLGRYFAKEPDSFSLGSNVTIDFP